MASSSDIDSATEALIAQLMAEDLGESYQRHSAPIGASWHDYEEPLSSYERQCLDAENNPDDDGEEGVGWGPEDLDGLKDAAAPDEGLDPTAPPEQGTWDSRFLDDDGQVQEHTAPELSPQAAGADDDDSHSDQNSCPDPTSEEPTVSPAPVASLPAYNIPTNPAGEAHNISAPMTLPTQPTLNGWPGPIRIPHDHLDPSHQNEPFIPSGHLAPNERLPASSGWGIESQWDDGLDYSSSKGKNKAVRAYDEFKRGLRDGERESWDPKVADPEHNKEQYTDYDCEEQGEIRDEDLLFIRVPWLCAEKDELLSRREDAQVVEIRVGDDETLESILRDISLREETRQKGKGKGVEDRVEHGGEEVIVREDVLGNNDVVSWW